MLARADDAGTDGVEVLTPHLEAGLSPGEVETRLRKMLDEVLAARGPAPFAGIIRR
jgi:hypothetical protein